MHKGKGILNGGVAEKFLICFAISALVIIILSLISALILGALNDPTKSLGLFSFGAMLLSAAASGICCARINGEGGIGFASLVALAVVLIMLLINVILSAGRVSGAAFMNYGCYFGTFLLSAFAGKKRNGHRRHRH